MQRYKGSLIIQGGQLCSREKLSNQSSPAHWNVLDVKSDKQARDHAVMGVTCGIRPRAVTGGVSQGYSQGLTDLGRISQRTLIVIIAQRLLIMWMIMLV